MLLANYKIQDLVTEQINTYLTNSKLAFSDLKALILSKSPIPQVQSNIIILLSKSKNSDKVEVQKALETQACKNQLAEDEQEKKSDQTERLKDEKTKERLNRELNHIPTQLSTYETESALLRHQLLRLVETTPRIELTHHKDDSILKAASSSSIDKHRRTMERLRSSIAEYDIKTQALLEQKNFTQIKLREIEHRAAERLSRNRSRKTHDQARVGYQSSGEGIQKTLSLRNRTLLLKSIDAQHKALDEKCADLILESEQINYYFFLEQLESYLPKAKLSFQEIEALTHILKFIKQHLGHVQNAANTEDHLHKKQHSISAQRTKLAGLKSQFTILREDNPNLTNTNQQLKTDNEALATSLANHKKLRYRLGISALLLLALTFLSSIPLIIIMTSSTPLFIPSTLILSLIFTPPILLLIATIAVGIAAAVYAFKVSSDDFSMKATLQTITNNTQQMKRNTQSLGTLLAVTIPSLEERIKLDESARDLLMSSLEKSQALAKQSFKQANEINPISSSKNQNPSSKKQAHEHLPAIQEVQESSDEEQAMEENENNLALS